MPATDKKGQTCNRPEPRKADPNTTYEETDVVAGDVFSGKVSLVHITTATSESWASAKPIEAALKLGDGSAVTIHCIYAKSATEANGMKSLTEVLSFADFPVITAYSHTHSEGRGMTNDTTGKLQSMK
jgi:hypothetical protein